MIASLVEACKLLGINPNAYLAHAVARIATRRDGEPLQGLLPGNWIDMNSAQAIFETNDVVLAE